MLGAQPVDPRQMQNEDPFGQIHVRNRPTDDELSESDTFRSVLFYCILILGGPIVSFAVTKVLKPL